MEEFRHTPPDPVVASFVREVIGTGLAWTSVLDDLLDAIEALEVQPWPDEDPAAVLVEMVIGTVAAGMRDESRSTIVEATRLIAASHERLLTDLRVAERLAGGVGRPRPQG